MIIIISHYVPMYLSSSVLCRCNLAGVILQLLALGVPDVLNFDFMSKPSPGKGHLDSRELLAPFMKLNSEIGCYF